RFELFFLDQSQQCLFSWADPQPKTDSGSADLDDLLKGAAV
ncbi:MAG: hypothetical protein RI932_924, partial [Pseudomonadota bacterium]